MTLKDDRVSGEESEGFGQGCAPQAWEVEDEKGSEAEAMEIPKDKGIVLRHEVKA
jgi:hypothetical protein